MKKSRTTELVPESDHSGITGLEKESERTKTEDVDPSPTTRKPSRKRVWLYRLIALTVVPTLAFGLLELGLRLFGYGYPTNFFILWKESSGAKANYVENIHFGKRFFPVGLARKPMPVSLPTKKEPETYRIFVFGESAAMGIPDRTTSFPRILEVMLRESFPKTNFEVINTAFTAINSHVALPIAKESAGHQPDLFVVHLGNNEVLGPFGAGGVLGDYTPNCRLIRASLAIKATRSGQLFERLTRSVISSKPPQVWGGMAMLQDSSLPADDARLDSIRANFQQNLGDICQSGTAVGAEVVVCTIPVNLRDCAPFASLHRSDLVADSLVQWNAAYQEGIQLEKGAKFSDALGRFQAAAAIDDRFADLRFRMARCLLHLGQKKEAQREYSTARDLDTLRFRTDSRINDSIREVVHQRAPHVHLADCEMDFSAAAESGIPGEGMFVEHVHMNFKGNYLLASSVFREISKILPIKVNPTPDRDIEPLSERECAKRLAYGISNKIFTYSTVQSMLLEPPFTNQLDHEERLLRWDARIKSLKDEMNSEWMKEEIELHESAVASAPNDWMIRDKYGNLLAESGALPLALIQYLNVLDQVPQNSEACAKAASIYLKLGQLTDAEIFLRKSLAIDDETALTHYQLAELLARKGRQNEGLAIFTKRLETDPNRSEVLTYLAKFHFSLGELAEARRCLDEALQINADDPQIHSILGHVLKQQGDDAGAAEQFALAEKSRPGIRPQATGLPAGQPKNMTTP